MRVLLVGEFSGFFINLKKGLQMNGVECVLAANGDGWKKIEGADMRLYKKRKGFLGKIISYIFEPLLTAKKLYNFDVVMLVDPAIYHPCINKIMFKKILKHNKKVFVSLPGGCFALYESYRKGELGHYIFDDNEELCRVYETKSLKAKVRKKQEKYIYDHVAGIIPIMYEYAVPVRDRKNRLQTIPIGFDCSQIEYKPNIATNKIVIMHGIIREKSKGTKEIKEALSIIKKKYGDQVEIILDGKKPLADYLKQLQGVNVLVDQCKEHCYGMNALYAMAEGRIVLGGASDDSLKEFGITRDDCPVFNIVPDVNQIVNQIEHVISLKDSFETLGMKSRRFVEDFHNCKMIAKKYIEVWEANN
ncbi:MAG: hypothetical protein J6Z04_06530 [Clostridia bacterium]|nr:hypothetical protein [Clostridia bacterium]